MGSNPTPCTIFARLNSLNFRKHTTLAKLLWVCTCVFMISLFLLVLRLLNVLGNEADVFFTKSLNSRDEDKNSSDGDLKYRD